MQFMTVMALITHKTRRREVLAALADPADAAEAQQARQEIT